MTTTHKFLLPRQDDLLLEVANASSDFILIADWKRTILFANTVACEKTGYAKQELVGLKIPQLYTKRNKAKYTSQIITGLQKNGRWAGEIEFQRKDKTTFWIDVSIIACYDEHGNISGSIGIGKDMSGSRLLSQHHWQTDGQLQEIVESMEDAVRVCDVDGTILMCNDAHCRMIGYRKEEILGLRPPYPWVDPIDVNKLRYGLKILAKGGKLNNYTVTWRRKDHSSLVVSMAFSLLRNHPPSAKAFVITIRDISDVQYVEDLRRSNERMQRLISDVQRKAERLQTLEEINSLVLKNTEAGRIFKAITKGIKKLVSHDLAGIYVYDSEHESLLPHTLSKQTPFSRKLAKFPLRLGEGIIGAAAVTGRMVWVNNAQFDPRSKYPEAMKPEQEHFIAVPLKGRGSIFGVLVVSRNSSPEFIEEEALIVKSFADAATVALENAR